MATSHSGQKGITVTTTEEDLKSIKTEGEFREFLRKSDLGMVRREVIDTLSRRDGYFCFLCKKPFDDEDEVTIDHWIPLAKGGTWALDNLRLAHKPCNAKKGDRMPNPDGTLPPHPKDLLSIFETRADKSARKPVCQTCESGRLLLDGEFCPDCGSGPQPASFPKYLQRKPKECDHHIYHCWMCVIGHIPRTRASEDVFGE